MPSVAHTVIIDSIINAIEQSGGSASYIANSDGVHPRKFLVEHNENSFSLWVYIWTLTHGGRPNLPNEYRIQLTTVTSPLQLNPTGYTVLLGYHPEMNMFAGFDLSRHQTFTTGSPSIQVNISVLHKALEKGLSFTTKENEEIAVGIRPDQLLNYIYNSDNFHQTTWIEGNDDIPENVETIFTEYDISASPNDFNIKTLFDFIDSGIVKIPGFQRNYVWDIKRASKLIESIVIGIPIPQIFLYEQGKNRFIVIDGQQRYMTIYYFIKKRFPKKEKRYELRRIFDENRGVPPDILNDNEFFADFNLQLSEQLPNKKNRLNGLNYFTFDEDIRTTFDLRTIRNIIIKQNFPENDDSVIYEIFNRLNSGGVNLKPQEIRSSLYHSDFYEMLYSLNVDESWRFFTPEKTPDLNMRDVEILLRGFAMLIDSVNYKPSMTKFLNQFSNKAKFYPPENIRYLENLFHKFIEVCTSLGDDIFVSKVGRFNISVFEAIFNAACEDAFKAKNYEIRELKKDKIDILKADSEFFNATQSNTASSSNVTIRLRRAKEILI